MHSFEMMNEIHKFFFHIFFALIFNVITLSVVRTWSMVSDIIWMVWECDMCIYNCCSFSIPMRQIGMNGSMAEWRKKGEKSLKNPTYRLLFNRFNIQTFGEFDDKW